MWSCISELNHRFVMRNSWTFCFSTLVTNVSWILVNLTAHLFSHKYQHFKLLSSARLCVVHFAAAVGGVECLAQGQLSHTCESDSFPFCGAFRGHISNRMTVSMNAEEENRQFKQFCPRLLLRRCRLWASCSPPTETWTRWAPTRSQMGKARMTGCPPARAPPPSPPPQTHRRWVLRTDGRRHRDIIRRKVLERKHFRDSV